MKKSQILFTILLFLGVWGASTAIAHYVLGSLYRYYHWSDSLATGVFLVVPALIFSLLIVTALNKKTALLVRIACGLFALLLLWGYGVMFRGEVLSYKAQASMTCLSNTKQITLAILMYTDDNDERLPLANSWVDATTSYTKNGRIYQCPADFSEARSSYAFNANLSGKKLGDIKDPDKVVLIFETDNPGPNPSGGKADFPAQGRHPYSVPVGFVDGHAKSYIFKT
jgi:hypothetical protein